MAKVYIGGLPPPEECDQRDIEDAFKRHGGCPPPRRQSPSPTKGFIGGLQKIDKTRLFPLPVSCVTFPLHAAPCRAGAHHRRLQRLLLPTAGEIRDVWVARAPSGFAFVTVRARPGAFARPWRSP